MILPVKVFQRLLLISVSFLLYACSYPSHNEIDQFISGLSHYQGAKPKSELISAFLNSLKRPGDDNEKKTAEYALNKLGDYYATYQDEDVLEGLIAVRMKGEFASLVCQQIRSLTRIDAARTYFSTQCAGLQVCFDKGFSQEELKKLCR